MKLKLCRVIDHQNKSIRYLEALRNAGYYETERIHAQGLRFVLTDADWRNDVMDAAASRGIPVFLYPHAARPMVQYDGCVDPKPVRCMFTHAEGGAELMRKIGYPNPVEVVGWSFSEVRPFRPANEVKRILFAPIHPNSNGYLNRVDKDLNAKTLERLEAYCRETGTELSVRLVGTPEQNGLTFGEGTEVHTGKKNNSTADMDSADLVVGHQTFAYLAIALGVPTVMMGEDVPPRTGNSEAGFRYVEHWEDYKDDLMFPLDILNGDPAEVIGTAVTTDEPIKKWRDRYIGKPFDGPAFVQKLESYL